MSDATADLSPDSLAAEYEALVDFMYQAPVALIQIDAAGRVEMINATAARLLTPVTRDGTLDNLFDVLGEVMPDLPALVAGAPPSVWRLCEDRRLTLPRTEPGAGHPTILSLALQRLGKGRFMAVIQDVSVAADNERRLRESEAFANRIIDTAPDAIIVADAEGRIVRVNARAEEAFGYTAAEMVGQPVEMLMPDRARGVHPAHRKAYMADPAALKAERPREAPRVVSALRKSGAEFTVEAGLGVVIVREQPHAVAMLHDITERIEAQSTLRRLNAELERRVAQRTAELERANEELASFSYTVAHDLRAPLRTVNGFATLLVEEPGMDPAEQAELLARMAAAGQRMSAQIEGLLELSRLSRAEVERQAVDLSGLARSIVTDLRHEDPAREVTVTIEPGLVCSGDPALMRDLMQNLLGNAWKYTGRTARAEIRICRREAGGTVEYFVADNGAGFDMAHAAHLFQVFHRLHRQQDFPGIGIGLATVRRIVERHGGSIRAEASPGKGATFYFTLESDRTPG